MKKNTDEELLDIYIRTVETLDKMYKGVAPYILEKQRKEVEGMPERVDNVVLFKRREEEYAKDKLIRA